MSENPAFSVTPKLNGDLFTIRGDTIEEFKLRLAEACDNLPAIVEMVTVIQAGGHAAPLVNTAAPATPAPTAPTAPGWGAAPAAPAAPPAAFAAATVPSCQHGPRTPRSGASAKGPWKAWFCPTPKGTPNQCDAIWVDRKSAEWEAFPA